MLKKISIIGSNTSNISSRKRLNQFFIVSIVLLFSIYVYTGLTHDRDDYEQWQFKRRLLSENNLIVNKSLIHKIPSLNCQTFLGTDHTKYITEYVNDGRFILNFKSHKFFNSCSEIENFLNISNIQQPDIKHSYAVSRVVHEDFYWLMEELSHTYSPKNSYCFAVDSKSSDEFIELMMKLESCIPNIYLSGKLYSYDSLGHYMNFGHWDCTKVLFKSYNKWSYILWLQNYDIILKTNKEISQIIQFLNGSHSVGYKRAHLKRYNFLRTRTAKSINLWKNESLVTKRQANAELSVSQMYNQVFLSRELIQFVIHNMNLENLLNEFEQPYRFATDELLWPTLLSSPDLQLPGQLKGGCKTEDKYITRYNEWSEIFPCEYSRHGTCIFGMEYFKMLADLHQIVANKILPRFDFGVVMCMGELLRNRSQGITESSAQMAMYTGIAKDHC